MPINGERVQIAANAVNAKLFNASDELKLQVSELLSFEQKARGKGQARGDSWAGKSSFFNFDAATFPAGFVHMIGKALEGAGVRVQYAIKQAPEPLGPEIGTFDPTGFGFHSDYDYQPETVRRLLRHKRMIAMVATGGGKSNICQLTYETIRRPTLFLTTRSALMYQMEQAFTGRGRACGVIGDGIWAPRKGFNVAMVQTLAAMLRHPEKRKKAVALLNYFEVLIGEEAHEVGGLDYSNIGDLCRNAHYRLALTATPFMRADEEANMRLQAVFGSVGIQISEKLLIDRGILATPYFKFARSETPALLKRRTGWPACYEMGVVENMTRHRENVFEALRMKELGLPVISLIFRERHGAKLNEMFQAAGLRSAFLFGKNEQSERSEGLRDLANRQLDVLIGSTIFDVGVDVPSVGMVQMAGGMKAEVGTRQRIGRALRKKKTGRNIAYIHDHADSGNNYLRDHALTRLGIVQATPGFSENILGPDQDYPFIETPLAA